MTETKRVEETKQERGSREKIEIVAPVDEVWKDALPVRVEARKKQPVSVR